VLSITSWIPGQARNDRKGRFSKVSLPQYFLPFEGEEQAWDGVTAKFPPLQGQYQGGNGVRIFIPFEGEDQAWDVVSAKFPPLRGEDQGGDGVRIFIPPFVLCDGMPP